MASKDELQSQLDDVNQQIIELGGEADGAFAQVGGEEFGAQDPEDVAAALTNAQENDALLQPLYERRRKLHDELGE